MTRFRMTTVALTMSLAFVASTVASAAPTYAPPPPTAPHLKSYSNWGALWSQWGYGTPASDNPVLDTTGANCAVGQPVPGTFFLAGTFDGSTVMRTCTTPIGDAFLIPILNGAAFAQQTDPPDQRTEAFVRSELTCFDTAPTLSITVDGVPLANPVSYLEHSVVFSVNLPADNVFGVPAQLLSPSVDAGYYAFVEPLSAGSHSIHLTAFSAACDATQNATYNLIVQGTVGTPLTCSGNQQLTLNNADIQSHRRRADRLGQLQRDDQQQRSLWNHFGDRRARSGARDCEYQRRGRRSGRGRLCGLRGRARSRGAAQLGRDQPDLGDRFFDHQRLGRQLGLLV